jgi:hypothetical protein
LQLVETLEGEFLLFAQVAIVDSSVGLLRLNCGVCIRRCGIKVDLRILTFVAGSLVMVDHAIGITRVQELIAV